MKNKLIKSLLALIMIVGVFTTVTNVTISELKAETNAEDAPDDWAFSEESIPLHDAILTNYGSIDTGDGQGGAPDGYISISEVNAYSGQINLTNKGISGTLEGIENFKNATYLNLSKNNLTGIIPENIGEMRNLQTLALNANLLSGSVPESIGDIIGLKYLYLNSNQLKGSIPESIENLVALLYVNLNNNQLSGTIPENIGNLTSLQNLYLDNNQLTGTIPTSLLSIGTLSSFTYHSNNIEISDLSNLNSLTELGITKAINANLSGVTSFYVSGSKEFGIRLRSTAGFATWDPVTSYYIIDSGVVYSICMEYYDDNGSLLNVISSWISLDQGGLMDNEGNFILGATTSDIVDGAVVLSDGGTIITGGATYTFSGSTTVSETEITTDGAITIKNNITDGVSVSVNNTTTSIKVPEGSEATISLDAKGGTVNTPAGSIVTNDNGSDTYLTGEGTIIDDGTITTSNTSITVPSDKVNDVTVDGSEVTFPEGVIVNDGDTSITYPGTIIYDTEDNSIQYLPVDGLFNEDGTLKDGVTQDDITNSQDFVNGLDDSTLKSELQNKVEEAQNQLDERNAEKAVEDLFDEDGTIKDTVTQEDIDNAQDLVNKLPEGDLKDELQNKLDEAQKQLDEKTYVIIEAFKVFTGEGSVYTKIDAPVEKFVKVYVEGKELDTSNYEVTSGSTVITLSEAYLKTLANGTYEVDVEFSSGAVVSTELTVRVTLTHPTITPPTTTDPSVNNPTTYKPSIAAGSSTSSSTVETGDTTNLTVLYSLLATSLVGLLVITKRRKEQN